MNTCKVPQRRDLLEIVNVERVNPASEKPEIGRGAFAEELNNAKGDATVFVVFQINNY